MARAPRAGRTAAFIAATLVAALALLAGPTPAPAGAQPQQPCEDLIPPCPPTTTVVEPTTSTEAATSTTARPATTTTARQTATTVRQTTTTAPATTTTLAPVTTVSNLLVPGDGTEGAESTTTTDATVTTVSDGGLSDGTLITLVIVGLLLIAVVVALLTWRYWVATRPPLLEDDLRSGPERGGRSARSSAPARW